MGWNFRYDPANVTCPEDCSGLTLPSAAVADCPDEYEIRYSEIEAVAISGVQVNGSQLEASNTPSDWTNIDGYSGLLVLQGFGDKPLPEAERVPLPKFQDRVKDRNHTVNFDTTDARVVVADAIRSLQCGSKVAIWYWTADKRVYGGADGIICDVDAGTVLQRGKTPLSRTIVFTWPNLHDPEEAVFEDNPQALVFVPPPEMITTRKRKKAA